MKTFTLSVHCEGATVQIQLHADFIAGIKDDVDFKVVISRTPASVGPCLRNVALMAYSSPANITPHPVAITRAQQRPPMSGVCGMLRFNGDGSFANGEIPVERETDWELPVSAYHTYMHPPIALRVHCELDAVDALGHHVVGGDGHAVRVYLVDKSVVLLSRVPPDSRFTKGTRILSPSFTNQPPRTRLGEAKRALQACDDLYAVKHTQPPAPLLMHPLQIQLVTDLRVDRTLGRDRLGAFLHHRLGTFNTQAVKGRARE
mmetsp:Transcript_4217/g.9048  ORF Transcript_4217/g.9048 Transcript_4217/m.9048 type:complete len:260 (-) Transcript_4217:255-1034(-)